MTMTRTMARFACGPIEASPPMARYVRLSLFDWAAVGIAGRDEPVARAARAVALAEGAPAVATLFGGGGCAPRAAALANGATSHALDYDDTHFGHVGHPSVAVIPAALALAEVRGLSGGALLDALAVGLELACRTGAWLGRAHYQAGFHQTGTSGAFGAAAAAGRAIGLDEAAMGHALGLVATRAAGLKGQFGTMGKPLNAGFAADVGLTCALLAEAGITSAPDAVEGAQGFGPTHADEAAGGAWNGLGSDWVFPDVSYKFHACCHGLHAMIEALQVLRPAIGDPASIRRVEVRTNPRWLAVCDQPAPTTGLGAKFSYRLTAAMALHGVETAGLDSYSAETCARPDLQALRDRVEVVADPSLSDTEAVVALDAGDEPMTARHDLLGPNDPEGDETRLRTKAAALIGVTEAEDLHVAVSTLTDAPDCRDLVRQIALRRG